MRLTSQPATAGVHEPTGAPPASSLTSGATRIASAQIVRRGFRLLVLLIAARAIGPTQFGVYTVILTITELIAMFSGSAYADYVTREVARRVDSQQTMVVKLALLRSVYVCAGTVLATAVIWVLRFSPQVIVGTALMGVTLLPRSWNELEQGILRGRQRFQKLVTIEATQGIALLVSAALVALEGIGLRGFILAELVSAFVGAVVAITVAAQALGPRSHADSPNFRTLIRSTFAFNLYPLIVNIYDRADVLLLSKLASNAAVGIYSLPYRLFATLQVIPYALMGALLPRLSGPWSAESERLSVAVLRGTYCAALVVILCAMLLASPALLFVLGPRYVGADAAFKILAWALIPVFFNSTFNTVLLAINRERVFLITATVCTLVNIIANVILIPLYSYRAAAAVTVLTEFVLLAQNFWLIRRALGHVPLPGGIARVTLLFGVIYFVATVLGHLLPSWIVGLIAVLAFAVAIYIRGDIGPRARRTVPVEIGVRG